MYIEAAPGISTGVGSAHLTPLLAPILKLVSYVLENFQSGLSPPLALPLSVYQIHINKIYIVNVKHLMYFNVNVTLFF